MLGPWMACESKREDSSCSCPLCPGTALAMEQFPDDTNSAEHANMFNEEILIAFRFFPSPNSMAQHLSPEAAVYFFFGNIWASKPKSTWRS